MSYETDPNKIDLPGYADAHRAYHEENGSPCNHDCQFYQGIKNHRLPETRAELLGETPDEGK
jgi:hypothetical protein